MKDLLDSLNEQQREAVTAPLGPVLILAGAGSGKTRALTMRIAYLIAQKLFQPEDILALTFTNKAAGEMKERIRKLLSLRRPGRASPSARNDSLGITMGTFHSVCVRILRADIQQLDAGYSRNFTIYDSDDSLRLVKQIVLELGLSDSFRPQVFQYYISAAKNKLIPVGKLALDNDFLEESLKKVASAYQKALRESNALDFDDLLVLTFELFKNTPAVLKKYQARFKYVLVDEYQDTNHVQYMLLKLLVVKHKNIFVVGDDAQSIYGFRGANLQNILDFKKDYPNAKVVMLEQNYRSNKPILDVANTVIKLNPLQYEKKLWTENNRGDKVNLYEASDENDEARFVLKKIVGNAISMEAEPEAAEYSPEGGILDRVAKARFMYQRPRIFVRDIPDDLDESVVLYRTHAQSRAFEEALLASGIPYQIIGGIKFYERREIKDALGYFRLLINPRDLVSLERVINLPARGIGQVAFKEIQKGLGRYDFNYDRLLNNLDDLKLGNKALSGAKEFFGALNGIKGDGGVNVLDVMEFILKRSGYKEALLKDGREGEQRWENVEELFNVAGKFRSLSWAEGLSSLLEEVALMTDLDRTEEGGNKLTLMTLHSAKGLEFDRVFFVGLEEGLLPHSRSLGNPSELAEEVRLAYVGITRARKNLYLTYAKQRQSYGEIKRGIPSRILKAIPKNLINKI